MAMVAPAVLTRVRARPPISLAVPAPVQGWNARDSLDQMEPDEAVILDNFFPGFEKVEVRKGHASHATGIGAAAVDTVAEYHSGTVRKLLAAGGGAIYDATSSGAASSLASGFMSNQWQTANFNGSMGFVNGSDAPQEYDGSTVSAMTVSGSGLTVSNLIGINVFKGRTYFWEVNSQDFWYSAVNTLGGTLTQFPLSRVGNFGGNLIAMATWSRDGGDGLDDLAVFIMSSGEVIVYAGDNPGDSASWSLVGVFKIGAPVSIRSHAKFGGDLIVATRDGYVSLEDNLKLRRATQKNIVSDKIRGAVLSQVRSTGTSFGWQIVLYPLGNMLLFNYPNASAGGYEQHVVNTSTGAWCRFKGLNGSSWAIYNDELYFGGAGGVLYKADTGANDNGGNIIVDGKTAFTYLGTRRQKKRVTAIAPVIRSDGDLPVDVTVDADFGAKVAAFNPVTFSPAGAGGGAWDTAIWDVDAWAGSSTPRQKWLVRGAVGHNFATRLRFRSKDQTVEWLSHTYNYEIGTAL